MALRILFFVITGCANKNWPPLKKCYNYAILRLLVIKLSGIIEGLILHIRAKFYANLSNDSEVLLIYPHPFGMKFVRK